MAQSFMKVCSTGQSSKELLERTSVHLRWTHQWCLASTVWGTRRWCSTSAAYGSGQRWNCPHQTAGNQKIAERTDLPIKCAKIVHTPFPRGLTNTCRQVLKTVPSKHYSKDGADLSTFLDSRPVPFTEDNRGQPLGRKEVAKQQNVKPEKWFDNPHPKRFQAVQYGDREALATVAGRLHGCYTAPHSVFNQIAVRVPDFKPTTLMDFGSGIGMASWAANTVWGKTLNEYFCVDTSASMNEMAEFLLKGGVKKGKPAFKNVFYRQYLPVSPKVKYNVVVAAHSLSEMPTVKIRRDTLLALWRKTEDFLVIIEHGTWSGFNVIREARRLILAGSARLPKVDRDGNVLEAQPNVVIERDGEVELHGEQNEMREEDKDEDRNDRNEKLNQKQAVEDDFTSIPHGYVFAPCPHDGVCPKELMILKRTCHKPCYFSRRCNIEFAEQLSSKAKRGFHKENFSYVVFRRGQRDGPVYGRVMKPVSRPSRHIHTLLCTSEGKLELQTLTHGKHRPLYTVMRRTDWGDMVPVLDIGQRRRVLSDELPAKRSVKDKHGMSVKRSTGKLRGLVRQDVTDNSDFDEPEDEDSDEYDDKDYDSSEDGHDVWDEEDNINENEHHDLPDSS